MQEFLLIVGYCIGEPDRRGFCGESNGIEFWERDRKMVPRHVAGQFDAGITGKDLIVDSGVEGLRVVADLCFSRQTNQPTRWVLIYNPVQYPDLLTKPRQAVNIARIGCELLVLAGKLGAQQGMVLSGFLYRDFLKLEGNEEASIADGLCDAALVVTETGRTIRDLGLQIVPGCESLFVSVPQIIAKPDLGEEKEERLQELFAALRGVIGAARYVMGKADVPADAIGRLHLPSEVSPTISNLMDDHWKAVEICILRSQIPRVSLLLERAGAKAIVFQDLIAYDPGVS